MRYGELGKRVAVAAVAIPFLFVIILWGKIPFLILVDIILVLALWEFYGLVEQKGFNPSKFFGITAILFLSWILYFYGIQHAAAAVFAILIVLLIFELFKGRPNPIANAACTLLGILYIFLFSSLILIRELPSGSASTYRSGGWIVILIFSTIWICDTAAYLLGARFGKHTLFKRVSPNKTWEGAIAGFIFGLIAAVGLGHLFVPTLSIVDYIVIGSIVGLFGQISDLIESLLKRDAGIKDTSNILPGHGGFLDRFDGPLFVGPLVYIYLLIFCF